MQQLTEHVAQRLRLLTLDRARRGNLPWPNANFVGRETELASLRAALLDAPEESPAGIHGVGGMGKTALAQAFAYKEADAFPGGCWLLRCEGRDRLLTVFRTLVNDLEIELTDEEKLDDAKAVRRVCDVLRARGPALFLLDNVDRPALLAQEQMNLLADQPGAHVLYTTRLAPDDFTKAGAMIRPLDLDRLPENQAVDLIRCYQPGQAFASPEHEAAAREIVRELSGLTLAVETAAVYLGQCDPRVAEPQYSVDARNYLTKLREDLKTGGSEGVMNQLREVTATLRPTLARLDAPARTVLQIASLLASDGVALPWVRAIAGQSHPELATAAATGESDPWTQLIRGLIGMRLFQPTPEPRVVSMHRILQRVLKSELPEGRELLLTRLEEHVQERAAALKKETHWQEARWELEPFDALALFWAETNHSGAAWLLGEVGQRWDDLAVWSRAEPLMRLGLAICEQSFGRDHPEVAFCLNNLAQLLKDTYRLAEAELMMKRALAIDETSLGSTHPRVATDLDNLAQLYRAKNRLTEAEPLMRRALGIYEKAFGPDHPEVATTLDNIACMLKGTNQLVEAESLMRRALCIYEKALGPEHHEVATALGNLADLLQTTNRLAEAETLFRRALAIDEQCYGSGHPKVARDFCQLATLLQTTNRLAEAETLFRRALAIDEQHYGPDHPKVANDFSHLAILLQTTNRLMEAEPLLRRALAINEHNLGADHPAVASTLNNLAVLLRDTNRLAEAEPLFRRVMEIFENSDPNKQPHYASALTNLAMLLLSLNRPSEAEPLMRRALAIGEQLFGAYHPKIAIRLDNLATLLHSLKRSGEAEPLMRRALAIFEQSYGPNHPDVALCLNNLAQLLQATNRLAAAEPLMRRVVEIFLKFKIATGREHSDTRMAIRNYAQLLQQMGRSPQDVLAQLNAVGQPFGFKLASQQ